MNVLSGRPIKLNTPFTDEMMDSVILFRIHFNELWNNWKSLQKLGIKLGGQFKNLGNKGISGPGCGVETYRLKGLYVDFRFFWAEGESANFQKMLKLISYRTTNNDVRIVIKKLKYE